VTALDPSVIRPIDVAAVNGKFFVNIAVAGSIAEVSPEELSSKWKRLLGPIAIVPHGAYQTFKWQRVCDGCLPAQMRVWMHAHAFGVNGSCAMFCIVLECPSPWSLLVSWGTLHT
jgi:hypothetical protein